MSKRHALICYILLFSDYTRKKNAHTCIRQRTYVHQATNVRALTNERTCIDQRTYVHSKFLLPLEIIATSTKFEVQTGYTNIHLRIAYH